MYVVPYMTYFRFISPRSKRARSALGTEKSEKSEMRNQQQRTPLSLAQIGLNLRVAPIAVTL